MKTSSLKKYCWMKCWCSKQVFTRAVVIVKNHLILMLYVRQRCDMHMMFRRKTNWSLGLNNSWLKSQQRVPILQQKLQLMISVMLNRIFQ